MQNRWLTILFLLLFLPYTGKAQSYTIQEIEQKADSVLVRSIGTSLFNYCQPDAYSFYAYKKGNRLRYKQLKKGKTKNHFIGATLRYHFLMPYPECKWLDTIKGIITVELDTNLQLQNQPDTKFIPATARTRATCEFITLQDALNIAKEEKIHNSIVPPYAYLYYNDSSKQYEWVVLRTLWDKHDYENNYTKDDMLIIDATNGAVIAHKIIPYAPHTR